MRRAVLLLAFMLSALGLCASTLQVGLVASPDVSSFASSALETLFSIMPPNGRIERINRARCEREAIAEQEKQIHSALASEREITLDDDFRYVPYYESGEVFSIVPIEADEGFISTPDENMLSYHSLSKGLDFIFIFSSSSDSTLDQLDVSIFLDGSVIELFSTLYIPEERDEILGRLTAEIVYYFDPSLILLDLRSFPGAAFYCDDMEDPIATSQGYALVKKETECIHVLKDYYEPLTISLDAHSERLVVLEGELVQAETGHVVLSAFPYNAQASLFGVDVRLPLATDFDNGTVLLSIAQDGFKTENLQLTRSSGGFKSVVLRPQWMVEDGRVKEAKDEMYRSMRNSILSFGLYVIFSSISSIYPETSSWSDIAGFVSAGISIINLIDFIHDGFAYYDTAKQVYL